MSSKIVPGEVHAQPSSSSNTYRRKSASKRPLIYSDGDDNPPVPSIRTKRPRTTDSDGPLSVVTSLDGDDDMDVDADAETSRGSAQRPLSAADDSHFHSEDALDPLLSHNVKTNAPSKHKKSSSTVVTASFKRKSQVVYSDDEEHSSHFEHENDLSDAPLLFPDASGDDFELDTPPRRGAAKVKAGATKGKASKAKPGELKGAKVKSTKDKDKDIPMKDERKLAVLPATTSRASSAAAQSQPLDLFTNEDPALSSAVDPSLDTSQPVKDPLNQTIPKKRKLPPIKKTKTATGTVGTLTPTTTTQKPPPPLPPPPPVQELAKPSLPTSEQRKQALTGVRDIDLGDSRVYAELFKGTGGIAPRSGLKNAEERRKELDKMRDEARARRAEEAKFTFDLQSQADKIARFEQRLRAENSTVLHPNFLAAKFRDEWELERRNRRVTPKEEGEA